jgi:hypothetical protein
LKSIQLFLIASCMHAGHHLALQMPDAWVLFLESRFFSLSIYLLKTLHQSLHVLLSLLHHLPHVFSIFSPPLPVKTAEMRLY